jgi:peptide-methionine (S)-S-oxide reductase
MKILPPSAFRVPRSALLLVCFFLTGVLSAKEKPDIPRLDRATFAAGCFWCIQVPFDQTPGVVKTTVGYTGGTEPHPTYHQVGSGATGHAESIEILYDPAKTSYEKLLDVFWHNIDPTTKDRQFPDWGKQYRTAIFYHNEAQKHAAWQSKKELDKSGRFGAPIVTEIVPATTFWPAEDYHQKYYLKSPDSYHQYHDHSGREEYFQKIWGK